MKYLSPFYLFIFSLFIFQLIPNKAYANTYQADDIVLSDLGRGFDTSSQSLMASCLTGTIVSRGNTKTDIRFLGSGDYNRRLNQMFGELSAGVDFFLFGAGASVSMTSRLSDSKRSFTSVLELAVEGKGISFEGRELKKDINFDHCGQSYVAKINTGHNLYFSTKLFFSSEESFKRFVTKIKIKVLFFKKTITTVDEIKDFDEHARYVIELNSPGTIPNTLTSILNTNRTNCRIDDIQACIDTTEKIYGYLFSENGYAKDMSDNHFYPTSIVTKRYDESGHFDIPSSPVPTDPQYLKWSKDIEEVLIRYVSERDYLSSTCQTQQCFERLGQVESVIVKANDTLKVCRSGQQQACESFYNDLMTIPI